MNNREMINYAVQIAKETNEAIENDVVVDAMLQQDAYRTLNNLYLELERGTVTMSLHFRLALEQLVVMAYDNDDFMRDWWFTEFQRLPHWFDF